MAVQISGNDITVPRDGTFSRNVSIAGTLTYEDVTNIDSVGLITARQGIEVGASPGVGASISVDGNMIVSGISTFGGALSGTTATFSGDVDIADKIVHTGDTDTTIRFPSADTVSVETGGSERARITSGGQVLIGNTADPSDYNSGADDLIIGSHSSASGITILSPTNNGGFIMFSDNNGGGANAYRGQIEYGHTDDMMRFMTASSERIRFGSSGQIGIAGANYGTSGQVLSSQGSGSAVQWATPSAWVFGTAADYDQWTSTTDLSFSGWPSTWQQIRVSFDSISLNANAYVQYFVSKSSNSASRITSGYNTVAGYYGNNAAVNASSTAQGFFHGTNSSSYHMTGQVDFYKFSGNIVRFQGEFINDGDVYQFHTQGTVSCDPTTDMTHIFFRGQGYAYDAGKFKLDYLAG